MVKSITNLTQKCIKEIYSSFGTTEKKNDSFYKSIASTEIDKIITAQKANSKANKNYAKAGFQATSLTSRIVQNQIAGMC